jgi:hypothetical protein
VDADGVDARAGERRELGGHGGDLGGAQRHAGFPRGCAKNATAAPQGRPRHLAMTRSPDYSAFLLPRVVFFAAAFFAAGFFAAVFFVAVFFFGAMCSLQSE